MPYERWVTGPCGPTVGLSLAVAAKAGSWCADGRASAGDGHPGRLRTGILTVGPSHARP